MALQFSTCLAFALCALASMAASDNSTQLLDDTTRRANSFGIKLFRTLSEQNADSNVLVSPLSAELALAQAYLGAGGNTATEMRTVLNLNENREDLLSGHKQLIQSLQKPVLKLASKLYVEKTFEVKKQFSEDAQNYFLSTVDKADFKGAPEDARKSINSWVENQTNQKIKDLLAKGNIDQDTRLVIVNALHFKDEWRNKFVSYDTYQQPFYLTPTKTAKVDMMHITDTFKYKQIPNSGTKVLELPYQDGDFRMVFLLPEAKDGLNGLIEKIATDLSLDEHLSNLQPTRVAVSIPKFKIEASMEMNDILKSIGIKDLFNAANANLTGISDKVDLVVSKVVQKVFMEVNEEGTEAAASTAGIIAVATSGVVSIPPTEVFQADHPFLVTLLWKNVVLFYGSVSKL